MESNSRRMSPALAAIWLAAPLLAFAAAPRDGARQGAGSFAPIPESQAEFAQLDRNDDGRISFREFGSKDRQRFSAIDRNGDGRITPEERRVSSLVRDLASDQAYAFLVRWDTNRDGLLSRDEFHGRPAAFVEADTDENNTLHFSEVMAMMRSPKPALYSPSKFIRAHDLDNDGLVAGAEWEKTQGDPDLFRAMDYNHNTVLSRLEIETFLHHYERRLDSGESADKSAAQASPPVAPRGTPAPAGQSLRLPLEKDDPIGRPAPRRSSPSID